MLERAIRQAILTLSEKGNSQRTIAKSLGISRASVKKVLESGEIDVPVLDRPELLTEHLQRVRELHEGCEHNLVRVHEELVVKGIEISYQALTAFCRRHGIGESPKVAAGRYDFMPGEEMQHDTSPHRVRIGGRLVARTCASLTLCFSRVLYAQVYPRWTRLEVRHFLSEAICALGGAASRCMLDNDVDARARACGHAARRCIRPAARGRSARRRDCCQTRAAHYGALARGRDGWPARGTLAGGPLRPAGTRYATEAVLRSLLDRAAGERESE